MSPDQLLSLLKSAIDLHKQGRVSEAEAAYHKVLQVAPNTGVALHNIGLIHYKAGQHQQALQYMLRSLELEQNIPVFYRNIGSVYRVVERPVEAIKVMERAIALTPNDGVCWAELGVSLDLAGRVDEAIPIYEKAIRMLTPVVTPLPPGADAKPADGTPTMELARAHYNLGAVYGRRKRVSEALAQYEASIRIVPAFGEAHRSRSGILFLRGRMAEAWAEYEWRWRCADYPSKPPVFSQPRWDGSPLNGKTILLWWEQGFGDTIQFCRYVPFVMSRGGRVVLLVQKELKRLIQSLQGPADVAINGEKKIEFDTHLCFMSLPNVAGTTLETIPASRAYLHPDPAESAAWEQRLAADGPGFRVGIAWAGAAAHKSDHLRSIPLNAWTPILASPGVKFYNLQFGEPARQLAELPNGINLIDHTAQLQDFAATAAMVNHLDLVICVDTALGHLAASIGKPTWLMLQHEPDFRWMADTDNPSRWYPSMRLFRQPTPGDWRSVIDNVAKELARRE